MLRILGFETRYKTDGAAVDWVHYTSRDALTETGGYTHTTWAPVGHLKPPAHFDQDASGLRVAAMKAQWEAVAPAYEAWKSGQELPEHGTPLGAWPGLTPQQAAALRALGIGTVEAVRDIPESLLAKPPFPGLRDIKRQAGDWLLGRDAAARDAEIAALREQNEAMLAMLAEATAEKADKPRRARETEAA